MPFFSLEKNYVYVQDRRIVWEETVWFKEFDINFI